MFPLVLVMKKDSFGQQNKPKQWTTGAECGVHNFYEKAADKTYLPHLQSILSSEDVTNPKWRTGS